VVTDTGATPSRVSVRMHRVGFGDCFLVSFTYAEPLEDGRSERHVLIDFGSVSLPAGWKGLSSVAEAIRSRTGGALDVVVLSHRHRDHLSAFGSSEIANLLQASSPPRLVVRPWTEAPNAEETFTGEGTPGSDSLRFVRALLDARAFAQTIAEELVQQGRRGLAGELHELAFAQLTNRAAITQLDTWAGETGDYLHYGATTKIGDVVPGITVRVLGPPTIEQHAAITSERSSDPSEFWMLYRNLVGNLPAAALESIGPRVAASENKVSPAPPISDLGPTRWLTSRLDREQLGSFLRIVRLMDDALNNTSVILLFEIEGAGGRRRMLFGGDAQIENWEYTLKGIDKDANLALLRKIDLYKVGHHGSRNATPRTLFNLWIEPGSVEHPIVSMMSTKSGVYGKGETAVPRETLVTALGERTKLFDSESVEGTWVEVSVDMKTPGPFTETGRG
jgi:hypothetical protein